MEGVETMLEKLCIEAYKDPAQTELIGHWQAPLNPDSYRYSLQNHFTEDQAIDTAGKTLRYKTQSPLGLSLNLVIDATGAVEGPEDLPDEIERLKEVAYEYNGEIHSPNYLRVLWGALVYPAMLERMDVDYTLFAPSGRPVRATIGLTLRPHEVKEVRARRAGKSSPDLTHRQVFGPDSNLPALCAAIYGDPSHYIDVARANDLDDITRIAPGTVIRFPPLEL